MLETTVTADATASLESGIRIALSAKIPLISAQTVVADGLLDEFILVDRDIYKVVPRAILHTVVE
jgi:hypothetical protein